MSISTQMWVSNLKNVNKESQVFWKRGSDNEQTNKQKNHPEETELIQGEKSLR